MERKSMPMVAWYILSNESYMKRVMSDVLPTIDHGVRLASSVRMLGDARAGRHTALFPQEDESTPEVSTVGGTGGGAAGTRFT